MERKYITGLGRSNFCYRLLDETHIYEVVSTDRGTSYLPLCKRGFNRDHGSGISIFRGNVGSLGVCQVCVQREAAGKPGLPWKRSRKTKKQIEKLLDKDWYSPLLPGLSLIPDLNQFPWREDQ